MGWCYVCVSLDSLCRWQVQVSVYCAWRIPAHLRCTQCSILLHLMDICFLTCICLWQISQIQTFLFRVVGPGLVSTSPTFVSNSASHPAGPHAQKTVNWAPIAGGGEVRHNLHSSLRKLVSHFSMFPCMPYDWIIARSPLVGNTRGFIKFVSRWWKLKVGGGALRAGMGR